MDGGATQGNRARQGPPPREEELQEWFKEQGIDVHKWTLVLFKEDHDRIHRGARGGPWNEAWRQYRRAHKKATKEELWLYAGELIQRFDLYGIVIPYYRRKLPPYPGQEARR